MKLFGLVLLFCLSTYLSSSWYICSIKRECVGIQASPMATNSLSKIPKPPGPAKVSVNKKSSEPLFVAIDGAIYFKKGANRPLNSKVVTDYLKEVAREWKKTPDKFIYLTGHTDSKGPRKSNYQLGLFRAQIMRGALVRYGVSKDKIKIKSFGEKKPLASNRTRKGRFLNRRVEIKIR